MASLDSKTQTFIVQQFAMYLTPQEIVDLVQENFGIETTRSQVFFYNADRNAKLAKKWIDLFKKTRDEFLSDTSSIAIAQRAYRLSELNTIYQKQKTAKIQNTKAMKETLEQAAKESGEAFTNKQKHEVTGKDGKDLTPRIITVNVVESNSILTEEPKDG